MTEAPPPTGSRSRTGGSWIDPAAWPTRLAAGVVLAIIALFTAVTFLTNDFLIEKAVLWIGFPACSIILARLSGLHAREVAILVIPTAVALIAVDLTLHGPLRVIAEIVVIFGTIAPFFSRRAFIAFVTLVARTRYGKLPDADLPIARAIDAANTSIGHAYKSDPRTAFHDALDDAYQSVEKTPAPDGEWAEVKRLFLRYLDGFRRPNEGEISIDDDHELARRSDAANDAYRRLVRARVKVRLSDETPTSA